MRKPVQVQPGAWPRGPLAGAAGRAARLSQARRPRWVGVNWSLGSGRVCTVLACKRGQTRFAVGGHEGPRGIPRPEGSLLLPALAVAPGRGSNARVRRVRLSWLLTRDVSSTAEGSPSSWAGSSSRLSCAKFLGGT